MDAAINVGWTDDAVAVVAANLHMMKNYSRFKLISPLKVAYLYQADCVGLTNSS